MKKEKLKALDIIDEKPVAVATDFGQGFYERLKKSTKAEPPVTDWDVYRKRNKLLKKDKVFICKEYHHFKKALVERGWHENSDYNSPLFHLKFTVKANDIYKHQRGTAQNLKGGAEYDLKDYQKVNHFYKHSFITSKVGLTQSLKDLHLWTSQVAMDDFYPKCFVLHRNDHIVKDKSNELEDGMVE